ncbi:AMP-dependent synthetase and ligase [Gemmatirosa kalamazoonensis]|uniref:AMP-dependent synthetase and ligase n=1 Tax=Gemmatirosa kalamazoonensis TaxID=861299 RepID=W0RP81_9BACT|nr:AMP-binding protein [Gemmatirosa kalamazoonensis]AHG91268.1 AMP-dependent synthetase and ligase [Gemmatirosa kalamazoonensis]
MSTPTRAERANAYAPSEMPRVPVRADALAHDTVLRRFLARAESTPDVAALRALAAGGAAADETITWSEWASAAACVAAALVSDGVRAGDRVAILAGNTPLWPIVDVGALLAGTIVVGLFPTCTAAQADALLGDCGARVLLVDGAAQLAKVSPSDGRRIVSAATWDEWLDGGRRALADEAVAAEIARRARAAAPDDVAGLIYTSGSTGEPKGACVSHEYLLASAESIADALKLVAGDSSLSVLPYAHAAERVFGHYTRIVVGMEAGLVADASRLWEAARTFRPTVFGGLPRLYERARDALLAARAAVPNEARLRWDELLRVGVDRSRLRRAGAAVPADLERAWASLRDVAAAPLASIFGDRMRLATSGGAPLAPDVAEALDAMGVTVLGAYGQTEHLCVAFHRPDDYDFDSVGRPMLGTELRIAADGELLIGRGALTFAGYWGRPEATRDAFTDDGRWLRTGDLARIDERGRLAITGRKKELLALSTGKKVAPLPIEGRLAEHPRVAQAVVFGDGRKHVGALLFLRDGAAADDASLDAHVREVNATLAPHEQVRRWRAVPGELRESAGELTATLKVKRAVVAARHADAVEALFR